VSGGLGAVPPTWRAVRSRQTASGDVLAGSSVAAAENRMPHERRPRVVQLMRKSLRAHGFDAF